MSLPGSPTALLLPRLNGVIPSRDGWRAECPACGGSSKKLAGKEVDGGKLLVRCYAGCDISAIVGAVGLSVSQLFPPRVGIDNQETRLANRRALREAGIYAAVPVLAHEAFLVAAAADEVARGNPLNGEDHARLEQAVQRIDDVKLVLRER